MPHILIVEDEPTTSWALAEGLSDDGYTIDTFRTAEEALAWLRGHKSDLVITDFRLPGLSGLELAQKLSRGRNAQPVIVVTAYGSPETVRELVRVGVSDVFPKPFHVDELRRAVRRALLTRPERRRATPAEGRVKGRVPSAVNRLPVRVRVAVAIEALSERDRLVLVLRLVEGLSPLEAAGTLKLTVRETEQRYSAAMLVLARELGLRPALRRAA